MNSTTSRNVLPTFELARIEPLGTPDPRIPLFRVREVSEVLENLMLSVARINAGPCISPRCSSFSFAAYGEG